MSAIDLTTDELLERMLCVMFYTLGDGTPVWAARYRDYDTVYQQGSTPREAMIAALEHSTTNDEKEYPGMHTSSQISDALGWQLKIEFIEQELGVSADKKEKRSAYFSEEKVVTICDKLAERIDRLRADPTMQSYVVKAKAPKPEKAPAPPAPAPAPAVKPFDEDDDEL